MPKKLFAIGVRLSSSVASLFRAVADTDRNCYSPHGMA